MSGFANFMGWLWLQTHRTLSKFLFRTAEVLSYRSETLKRHRDFVVNPFIPLFPNPLAEPSVARLYSTTKQDKNLFRWPHTAMIGGVLIPLKTLVSYITPNRTGQHPIETMCWEDTDFIEVTMSKFHFFETIHFPYSSFSLGAAFAPGDDRLHPWNDIMIVLLDELDTADGELHSASWIHKVIIAFTGYATGVMLVGCGFWGFFQEDMSAAIIFAFYAVHWLLSTLITLSEVVTYEVLSPGFHREEDIQYQYAVNVPNPGGHIVVFKARGSVFDKLANSRWKFQGTTKNNILYWSWLISGTLAAISSFAYTIDMTLGPQLAFIGILGYSSVAEAWVTCSAERAQRKALAAANLGRRPQLHRVVNMEKRSYSIIHASLGVRSEEHRIPGLDWVKLKVVTPVYQPLQELLDTLNSISPGDISKASAMAATGDGRPLAYHSAVSKFREEFPRKAEIYPGKVDGIIREVELAWNNRHSSLSNP